MKLNEESSDFVYLGKRIDKALDYIQNSKTDLLDWFKQYVEIPYQDIMSGELDLEEEDYTFDYLDSLLDDLEKKFNVIFETKNKMTQETLRIQFLSGIITESEYKVKLEELNSTEEKNSLNEHYIAGGIVGVGAINNPFEGRKKESYEDAFEHFLGQKYSLKEAEEEVEEGKEVEEPSLYEGELNENIGSSIEKMIDGAKFEFSEKGNDEMIELANYILTPEGAKNVAMSLKNRLKGEGGENYFTSKPEALQSLLDKLK